ncbi:peptidase S8/S53 domain-containing protein [Lactarius quietus]|nr:peptidase S8/S53 domain-containing protein [Lactarius quietus]
MHHLRLSVLFALAAALLGGVATPLFPNWNNLHTKHKWNAVPGKWDSIGRPPMGTTIDLRIALKPQNENALLDALYEEQVAELVAPHPDDLNLVESWLEYHGVSLSNVSRSHGGGWLTVAGVPVSKANDLLGASYHLFRHAETKETIIRTLSYALPSALHRHVQTVAPTTYFGSPGTLQQTPRRSRAIATRAISGRDQSAIPSPAFLRSLYKSEGYVPSATDKNVLGITGFWQYASYDDLKKFMDKFRFDGSDATFSVVEIDSSGYNPNMPGHEANVDMQYAQAIAYPTPHVFYSIGGVHPPFIPDSHQPESNNEPWLDWLGHMIDLPDLPQTISTSYAATSRPSRLTTRGDSGVGAGDCKKNDGSGVVEFQPVFPPTCPYVTSVGGTKGMPEAAAEISSGGFSNIFKRPPYQDYAVGNFFHQLGDQYSGLYNASSRGFPDVSSQASVSNGMARAVQHLYAIPSPVVAGLISLLNDYRLSKNMPPLGFLNPRIYGDARLSFNDITSGSNPGCGTEGFSAVPGWDPVTGLGTLDFTKLLGILSVLVD